jgi:hypothetical protein
MILLKNILLEAKRSVAVPVSEVFEFLKTKKDFLKSKPKYIYRGNEALNNNMSYIVKPSEFYRESQNTTNYYTICIDNLPEWESYPKRSRSIVCSTDSYKASTYGDSNYHIVFPINRAVIGVCSDKDIWTSFENSGISSMHRFNNDMGELFSIAYSLTGQYMNPQNWQKYLKVFSNIDKFKRNPQFEPIHYNLMWVKRYFKEDITFYDALRKVLNPIYNDFSIIENYYTAKHIPYEREVWISDPCYLISRKHLNKFLDDNNIEGGVLE